MKHLLPQSSERRVLFYRHPMNPAVTSPVPAKDAMGMDYVPVYADDTRNGAQVKVSASAAQNLGVRLGKVERVAVKRGPFARSALR